MAPVLCYWDVRGLTEPIRLLLHYAGVTFEDKRFALKPNFDKSEWLKEKFTLGLDFPNLPYYIDGEVKLTQSKAILRYLARKHGLAAKHEEEQVELDVLEGVVQDFAQGIQYMKLYKEDEAETFKKEYFKTAPQKIEQLADYLEEKDWLTGERITYVDFLFFEALLNHKALSADLLAPHPNLLNFLARFESLKGIKEYMATPAYHPLPHWATYKFPKQD